MRIIGFICPDCGTDAHRVNRQRDRIDQWIGYVYTCSCSGCITDWMMLFTDNGHFCGLVRERELYDAGVVRQAWEFWSIPGRDAEDIPF